MSSRRGLSARRRGGAVRGRARGGGRGRGLRVAGTGHSFTPLCATDGTLVSLDDWQGVVAIDAAAAPGDGARGHEAARAGRAAARRGPGDAEPGRRRRAGARGRGVDRHARDRTGAAQRVVAGGRRAARARERRGARARRGARSGAAGRGARVARPLGVFSELRLQLVPAYRLHERIWRTGIEECLAELAADVAATRHYEFWWYPHKDYAERKALAPTEAPSESVAGSRASGSTGARASCRRCASCSFNEMEYSCPRPRGRSASARCASACVRWPDVVWPVEYRTLAADVAWLSDRPRARLGRDLAAPGRRAPCDPFFADCEPIFTEHGGRPHWGKLHTRSARELAALYPRWDGSARCAASSIRGPCSRTTTCASCSTIA